MKLLAEKVTLRTPTKKELQAAVGEKPRFFVDLLLALIDKRNGNKHRLKREEVDAAIGRLKDRPMIPGNLDHNMQVVSGTSSKIFVKDAEDFDELWLEGVYWTKKLTEEQVQKINAKYESGALGASWEIDPYEVEAATDIEDTLDIKNFEFSGFGIMVDSDPAEEATRGAITITAKLEASEEDKKKQEERAKRSGIGIKEGGHVTKPSEYSNVPDSEFLDNTNYKYPCDEAHLRPALQYFNHEGQREAGGYSTEEWAKMGKKLANALGEGYQYKDGKVVSPNAELGIDEITKQLGDFRSEIMTEVHNVMDEKELQAKLDEQKKTLEAEFDARLAKALEAKQKEVEDAEKLKHESTMQAKIDEEVKKALDTLKASLQVGASRIVEIGKYETIEANKQLDKMIELAEMDEKDYKIRLLELENEKLKASKGEDNGVGKPKEPIHAKKMVEKDYLRVFGGGGSI